MAKRVQLNHAAMRAMLASVEVRHALHPVADRIKSAAQGTAPVGDPEGGHYRDNFVVTDRTSPKDGRAVVRVENTSAYAAVLEARLRILGAAIDAGRV